MRITVNTVLIIAMVLTLLDPRLAADTLYKKSAAVAIGFGDSVQSSVSWSDCSHSKKKTYTKPPYWIDKGDDCKLHADLFGLEPSGQRYVAGDVKKASLFFPDVKRGEFVDFSNDSADGLIELTYRVRSLRLPYAGLPLRSDIIWNELSVAEGFANIGQNGPAKDLLQDSAEMLQQAPPAAFPVSFIMDTAVSLFRIKPLSPEFPAISHASLLRLAYLRSTLEPAPRIPPGTNPGCVGIPGGTTIDHNTFILGAGDPCGLALGGGPPGSVVVKNSIVQGGTHVLDGIQWDHDLFIGSRIRYRGGPVLLNKISFISCTFEVEDSPRGDQVVDYAISRPPKVAIGIEVGLGTPSDRYWHRDPRTKAALENCLSILGPNFARGATTIIGDCAFAAGLKSCPSRSWRCRIPRAMEPAGPSLSRFRCTL